MGAAKEWYDKGVAFGNLGKLQEAIDCYDRALEIDPRYAKALHNKAVALNKLGRHNEAVECLDKAKEIDH